MNIVELAAAKAKEWHQAVNQKYDGKDYFETHVKLAVEYAKLYICFIPKADQDKVMAAVYLHDTLEDCHITYNELLKLFGFEVAEMVYAVTNDKGRTRSQRAGKPYYKGIRKTKYARFIKIVDRMANVFYSKNSRSGMFKTYLNEHFNFIKSLKGTHTLWGRFTYWFKKLTRQIEIDYDFLYLTLHDLYTSKPL